MTTQKQDMSKQDLPTTRFERVFFRYIAWFPILTLPMLVWELMETGQMGMGLIIGLVHAVLVFRFVSVNNVPGWFKKKGS
ncbi:MULTISPECIES: hypothetical protein [Thalassolituus]|jgi:bacteriorhodopsin|uniref:Uncharacterized protein n=1 Tax=Thalassolituus maritimus TaxID=484498 RepID=A0A1N7JRZ6_9GAMM|nr:MULTISPECIES: hypothetical protein [Thalassolituus]KZZ07223.1 hypothetical protein A3746_02830 [Oleibacter sp. HI0075]MAG42975.1 hypothetical protein [Oceanospirillaceae bacterium]MEC8908639.1 hypothetical protein [Pseudomonadota bacterium]MAX85730.1 hypothetical protein [Oceanospirillaceae bacterium]MBN56402.1 hypothetical protein [Oceanospirillaceae bacterium]|tara:strand:- start:27 stop:266 length:240 start_codon:yes stop_codon:yes gene_type:complete